MIDCLINDILMKMSVIRLVSQDQCLSRIITVVNIVVQTPFEVTSVTDAVHFTAVFPNVNTAVSGREDDEIRMEPFSVQDQKRFIYVLDSK